MRLQRYLTSTKQYPLKKFLKPWVYSPSLNFHKKDREFYQNWIGHVMLPAR